MPKQKQTTPDFNVTKRLDAAIRLLVEIVKNLDQNFSDREAIKAMYSVGLTPSEIAKILGWKSRGAVGTELNAARKNSSKSGSKKNSGKKR